MPPAPPHEAALLATLLLQKCTATKSLRRARQLHALLLTSTPTPPPESPFVNNNILSMYARCGSFHDSQQLFDKMPHRNIVSYNVLISAYSRCPRNSHLAFRLFDQLENENLVTNALTMTSLLQASVGLGSRVVGSSLHGHCLKKGFLNNVRVQTSLLGMYSGFGDVDCAKEAFWLITEKDAVAWNTIISGYVRNGRVAESLELFRSMLRDGMSPNNFTYSLVLTACAKLKDSDVGKLVHANVLVWGTDIDLPLLNALLDMYCSCGDTNTAFNVFLKIDNPDLVSWNSMIGGYSENGDGEKAMDMFVRLEQVSFAKPDEYSFAAVISGTGGFPAREYGKPLHAQTEKIGFTRSAYIRSTLISMYFSNDDSESSLKILNSSLHKDAVLWTDMIAGYVRLGESEGAMKFFHEMFLDGWNPDSFALSSVLSACADLVTLRQGEMIHCLAVKTGFDSETCVHGTLVDMYAKNGELEAAAYIFSSLPKRDLMCWNSMLAGYGHSGMAKEAFRIFYEMLKHGLRPDHVTFLSLLAACSHCGLVSQSRFFWNYMKENCTIGPGPKHYSCMVNLLSRAGLWEEAEEMIVESPFVDNHLELWRTILSSCIKNGNLRKGIHAAEQVLSLNTEDNAANILVTKIYAAAGNWNEVQETRRKMRRSALEKDVGLSWIEASNNVHVFCSGDQAHVQNAELRDELGKLLGNIMPTISEEVTQLI